MRCLKDLQADNALVILCQYLYTPQCKDLYLYISCISAYYQQLSTQMSTSAGEGTHFPTNDHHKTTTNEVNTASAMPNPPDLPVEIVHNITGILDRSSLAALRQTNRTLLAKSDEEFTKRYCKVLRVRVGVDALETIVSMLQHKDIASTVRKIDFHVCGQCPEQQLINQELLTLRRLLKQLMEKVNGTVEAIKVESFVPGTLSPSRANALDEAFKAIVASPLPKLTWFKATWNNIGLTQVRQVLKVHGHKLEEVIIDNMKSSAGAWIELFEFMLKSMKLKKLTLWGNRIYYSDLTVASSTSRFVKWFRNPETKALEHASLHGGEQLMCGPVAVKYGLEKTVEALSNS